MRVIQGSTRGPTPSRGPLGTSRELWLTRRPQRAPEGHGSKGGPFVALWLLHRREGPCR